MLILTRDSGQTIMVGDEITVTVLGVQGNQVRLGISAPKSVAVHRSEIYEKIQSEKLEKSFSVKPVAHPLDADIERKLTAQKELMTNAG